MPIFFIAIGLFYALFPRLTWKIEGSWKSNKKEPSRNTILIHRIVGIILCLMGIYQMVK